MHRLLPGSPRIAAAIAFGQALDAAMQRKGVGRGPLAAAAGVGSSAIGEYRRGMNLPSRATALRLAHALSTPALARIVEEARRGACAVCKAPLWQDAGRGRAYCSVPCRVIGSQAGQAQKRRGSRVDRQALEGALEAYRCAVDAFCGECPSNEDGFCGNLPCPLLAVSRVVVPQTSEHEAERVQRPDPWNAQGRANRGAGIKRAWAADPDRKTRLSEQTRARHAAMTDEERAAFRTNISEARRRGIRERGAAA